jgi:hypothetical protein
MVERSIVVAAETKDAGDFGGAARSREWVPKHPALLKANHSTSARKPVKMKRFRSIQGSLMHGSSA